MVCPLAFGRAADLEAMLQGIDQRIEDGWGGTAPGFFDRPQGFP